CFHALGVHCGGGVLGDRGALVVVAPAGFQRTGRAARGRTGGAGPGLPRARPAPRRRRTSRLARPDGLDLDLGHGRALHRPPLRAAQARPRGQPGQDLGGRLRGARRGRRVRRAHGLGIHALRAHRPARLALLELDPHAARHRGRRRRRRPVRVADEARRGRQGQRQAAAGARRLARPHRRADRRAAGRRADLLGVPGGMKAQNIAILGATGSIGASALDVIARHPERFRAWALTANRRVDALAALCAKYRPAWAGIADARLAPELERRLREAGVPTQVAAGAGGLAELAERAEVDTVIAAIVGAAGLRATLAAAAAGKKLLLANKEAL